MALSGSCLLVDLQAHSTRWPPPADAQRLSMWRAQWPAAQFGNPSGWLICSVSWRLALPRCGRPFQQEGGLLGPPAAFVRVEVLTGVPGHSSGSTSHRGSNGSRVRGSTFSTSGEQSGAQSSRVAAANADPPLEVVDLLGLNYARGLEQRADNEAALVPAIHGQRRPHPARRMIVFVAVSQRTGCAV